MRLEDRLPLDPSSAEGLTASEVRLRLFDPGRMGWLEVCRAAVVDGDLDCLTEMLTGGEVSDWCYELLGEFGRDLGPGRAWALAAVAAAAALLDDPQGGAVRVAAEAVWERTWRGEALRPDRTGGCSLADLVLGAAGDAAGAGSAGAPSSWVAGQVSSVDDLIRWFSDGGVDPVRRVEATVLLDSVGGGSVAHARAEVVGRPEGRPAACFPDLRFVGLFPFGVDFLDEVELAWACARERTGSRGVTPADLRWALRIDDLDILHLDRVTGRSTGLGFAVAMECALDVSLPTPDLATAFAGTLIAPGREGSTEGPGSPVPGEG